MKGRNRTGLERVVLAALLALLLAGPAAALAQDDGSGNFNGQRWPARSLPFTLELGDNVSGQWERYVQQAAGQWTRSDVVRMRIVRGTTNPNNCDKTDGKVEVCSDNYGSTGWLGLTRIFFDNNKTITAATVKLNDSYFKTGPYDNRVAKLHTTCHELGHSLGLDHTNGKSCMNPSQQAVQKYDAPSRSDFRRLDNLYKKGNRNVPASSGTAGGVITVPEEPTAADFSPQERQKGETRTVQDLGNGRSVVTIIDWAE